MWTHSYLVLLVVGSAFICHTSAALPSMETTGAEAVVPDGVEFQLQAAAEVVPQLYQPFVIVPPGYTPTAEPTASEALVEESVVGPAVAEAADPSQATVADAEAAAVTPTAVGPPTNAAQFETTTAFNTFPWKAPVARAVMFNVEKLTTQPTVPPAWANRTLWSYTPAGGYLIAVDYTNTPVGPYSELLYITGNFSACSTKLSSVVRNWVSSAAAADATRRIWGTPKQLATFAWSQKTTGTGTSAVTTIDVAVTDSATKQVIFNVSTKTSSLALPAQPDSARAVHFPINDNVVRNVSGKVSAYSVGEQAFTQKKAISTTFGVSSKGGKAMTYDATKTVVNTAFLPFKAANLKSMYGSYGATILNNTVTWNISQPVLC